MKYKAIIFDFDGLIADTEIIEHRSLLNLLREYSVEPRPHANGLIHRVGGGEKSEYDELKERYFLQEDVETIKNKKRAIFRQIIDDEGIKPYPGFIELLLFLKNEEIATALASNRNEELLHRILDILSVKKHFNVIVGKNEGRKSKPHPDIYLCTAKELGIHPKYCIALEDSETGIISAKNAGMKAIAIPNIYTKDQDFSKADIIVESLLDINIDLFDKL